MNKKTFFSALMLVGFFLGQATMHKRFSKNTQTSNTFEIVQNTYFGPTHPVPNEEQLVKVQILVKDSPQASGPQIESVVFNGQSIPLKPRDIFGKRGEASFQLMPGKYRFSWTTNQNKYVWPRNSSHQEELIISPRDLWIQILIEGDSASIR